jgi:hypothetical protein
MCSTESDQDQFDITPSYVEKEELARARAKLRKYSKKIRFHTWIGNRMNLGSWRNEINAKPGALKGNNYLLYISRAENEKGNKEKIREKVARRIAESFAKIVGYLINVQKNGHEGIQYWKSFMESKVNGLELKEKEKERKEKIKDIHYVTKDEMPAPNSVEAKITQLMNDQKGKVSGRSIRKEEFKVLKSNDFLYRDLAWSYKYDLEGMKWEEEFKKENRHINEKEFKGPIYNMNGLDVVINKRRMRKEIKEENPTNMNKKERKEMRKRRKLINEYNNKIDELYNEEKSKWKQQWSERNPRPVQQSDSIGSFIENLVRMRQKGSRNLEKQKEINRNSKNWYDPSFGS